VKAGAPFFNGIITTTAVTTAQSTVGLADLLLPGDGNETIFDAGGLTIGIQNGADQTITGITATFSDVVGGQGVSTTYTVSSPSIAAGAAGVYYVAVNAGVLRRLEASVSYGVAPTAGKTVQVQAVVQGH